jgi:hypothetical protein
MTDVSSEISQIIQLATGVPATNAQISGWTAAVNSGLSLLDVAKSFVASDAFAANFHVDNTSTPLAQLVANIPSNNPLSGLLKSEFAPFPDTSPSVTLTQEIIQHTLGQSTDAQVAAWVNSGLSVAEVLLSFASNDVWASTVILTHDPNYDGFLPDGEFTGESGTTVSFGGAGVTGIDFTNLIVGVSVISDLNA